MSGRSKQRPLERQLLVFVTLALTFFGLVMVYSATSAIRRARQRQPDRLSRAAGHRTRRSASRCSSSPRATTSAGCSALAPPLIVASLFLCAAVLVVGAAHQRRAPVDRVRPGGVPAVRAREARARHLVRRVSRAQAGAADAQGSRAADRPARRRLLPARARRARPRHGDHDRRSWSARCCSSPARALPTLAAAYGHRVRARRDRCVVARRTGARGC